MKTILVKSGFAKGKDGGFKLAIHETHSAHKAVTKQQKTTLPNGKEVEETVEIQAAGELYIADDKIHRVAMTQGVRFALNEKRLVEVDEDDLTEAERANIVGEEPAEEAEEFVAEVGEEDEAENEGEGEEGEGEDGEPKTGNEPKETEQPKPRPPLEVMEDDTVDSLKKRYWQTELVALTRQVKVEQGMTAEQAATEIGDDWTKDELAREVLGVHD